MRSKITLKKALLIASITVSVIIVVAFILTPIARGRNASAKLVPSADNIVQSPANDQPVVPAVVAQQETPAASVGGPVRLKIPSIKVNSSVEHVGLTANGEMDVPKDTANVAWLKLGTRPGNIGSAVIAGHYGILKNGNGSIFDNLSKLKKGDQIFIEDDKGATIVFIVRESQSYDANAAAPEVFSSGDGKSHLNLVTCQNWDKVSETYTQRLVVFADRE